MTNLSDHFLLWLPRDNSVRRGKNAFGLDFPSWSWAGWVGAATYAVSGDVLDGREVVRFDEEACVEGYRVLVSKGGGTYYELEPEEIEDDVLVGLEWCKLSFTAQSAEVGISMMVWGYFLDCDSESLGDFSRCQRVYVYGKFAGMMQLHMERSRAELEDLEAASPLDGLDLETRTVEVTALSTTYRPWPVYFPVSKYSRDDVNFYYTDRNGEERDHLPFDTDYWNDQDPEMVNVMMIEWNDDGDLATRAGVGQIHLDAWRELKPVDKKIILG